MKYKKGMKYKIVEPDDITDVKDYLHKAIKAYSCVSTELEFVLTKVDLLADILEESDGSKAEVTFLRNITKKYK